MDVQDHRKTTPSEGHEGHGVYLCHKCGWPFPNPHPSAKHRRAHKRVCGKVEGYKPIDSETDHISDDDHPSDDDNMKTPSPKVEKGSLKEVGSGDGTALKSCKSEDDVFSDAVTDFSDSGVSPSIEERLETVRGVDKIVGKELVHELNGSRRFEDCQDDDMTKPQDGFTIGRDISNAEIVESVINQSETIKLASHSTIEGVSSVVEETDSQQINSSRSAYETISGDIVANAESEEQKETIPSQSKTDTQVKESVNEVESSTESVVLLNETACEAPLTKSTPEVAGGGSGLGVVESMVAEADRKVSDTMTIEPKLQDADGSIAYAVAEEEIVEHERETSNKLEAEMTGVSTVDETEQEKGLSNVLQDDMTKLHRPHQIEPQMCTDASVTTQDEADTAEDTIQAGHDELAKVCDLKEGGDTDVRVVSVVEIVPAVENPEIMLGEFKDYNVLKSSFPLNLGDGEASRSVEDDNKVNMSEPPISFVPVGNLLLSHSDINCSEDSPEKDVLAPVEGEVDTSGLRRIKEEGSESNGLEGSSATSGFENQVIEGCQPKSADKESSNGGVSAPSSIEHSDVIPAVYPIDEETSSQTTKLNNSGSAGHDVTLKSDHVRTENETSDLPDKDNVLNYKQCTNEVCVEASQGTEIGKNTEVQRSGGVSVVDPDLSPESHRVASGEWSENSKEMETQSSSSVSQLKSEDHGGVSDEKSEDYKEAAIIPVASTILSQSSASVEDKTTKDAVTSEPLHGDDAKLIKESLNISAVNDSIVSSSRAESLDGNWGSVSVLSGQSDGTALPDAESLSSAGNQGPEKSEGTLSKLQTSGQDNHSNKSDAYEPPSFMTLVESQAGDNMKVVASETHNAQKSEAQQAGWFPSLTNVVNESEGRKKNEEIIAKVTNWSTGKQHSPLKNLLNEAQAEAKVKSTAEKQVPPVNQGNETASKNNGAAVTTVGSIMGSEMPVNIPAKKDVEKEWNSPARYPVEIKKEKKKGKPYWVPFVCCTSVHQDI